MTAFYNEIEPYAAEWLRNLIAAGHIAPGVVDERSIVELDPDELRQYRQCHFFAGIGGWSYALRLAGWPDDRPVWTGSCPCQPFSTAGEGAAHHDDRHLWPAWFRLIRKQRPSVIFGEQVASTTARAWIDHVCADLEDAGYAAAAANLPACGIGAPHGRPRLWFVAHTDDDGRGGERAARLHERRQASNRDEAAPNSVDRTRGNDVTRRRQDGYLGDAPSDRLRVCGRPAQPVADESNHWAVCEWVDCADGKQRPIKPGIKPLAYGLPRSVGRLRAYGNAIVPQVAAEFVRAYLDVMEAA